MFSPSVLVEGEGIIAIEYGGSTIDKNPAMLLNRIREFASFSVKPMNNCEDVANDLRIIPGIIGGFLSKLLILKIKSR